MASSWEVKCDPSKHYWPSERQSLSLSLSATAAAEQWEGTPGGDDSWDRQCATDENQNNTCDGGNFADDYYWDGDTGSYLPKPDPSPEPEPTSTYFSFNSEPSCEDGQTSKIISTFRWYKQGYTIYVNPKTTSGRTLYTTIYEHACYRPAS